MSLRVEVSLLLNLLRIFRLALQFHELTDTIDTIKEGLETAIFRDIIRVSDDVMKGPRAVGTILLWTD